MFKRSVSALVLAAATFAPIASHAFPIFGTNNAAAAKVKMVKMTLKNKTSQSMDLMIDDKPVTIAANGEYQLKAAEGTKVYGADKTLKVTVTKDLDGTTCSFR